MASALELSVSLREEASVIYRRGQGEGLVHGRSIEALAAGSLYAALRCRGSPRTLTEVVGVARVGREKVLLGYRVLNTELGLETQVIDPRKRVPVLAAAVDSPDAVGHRASELARLAEESGIANERHPGGLAAACVYLAGEEAGISYTQTDLANYADVNPVTIRDRYNELQALIPGSP